ncbi:MAG: hypothetical protein ACKVIN_04730, partial [Longimicrobiales bacterium]
MRTRSVLASSAFLLLMPATTVLAQESHRLPLEASKIHWGYYDATLEPVLRIRSGDRVSFDNLLARGPRRVWGAGG